LAKSTNKDHKSDEVMKIEGEIKEVRISKDTLTRNIGRIEGEIASLLRILKKQKDAESVASNKTVVLNQVENIAKQIDLEIDGVFENPDVSKIKEIFRAIKKILRDFIDKNKDGDYRVSSADFENDIKNLESENKGFEIKISDAGRLETELSEQYSFLKSEIEKERDSNRDAEKAMFRIVAEQSELHEIISTIENREVRLKTNEDDLRRELQEASVLVGVPALRYKDFWPTKEDGSALTLPEVVKEPRTMQEERRRALEKVKIRLEDAGVAGGDEVMKEFKETSERDTFLGKELEDLIKSSESLKSLIKELDEKLTNEFKSGVAKINTQFQEFFTAMFGGGTASLSVVKEKKRKRADTDLPTGTDADADFVEEEEEQEEGLDIEVNLPRKKTKGLMMLSGGERALTSIALLFAISQVNPPPFIILDETDAALDEANSRKYGDMISNLSKYSQLILITHNRETMSRAGVIYGVTMGGDGVSRLLSIQFEEAVQVAK
jgi:chromosome segregation protein